MLRNVVCLFVVLLIVVKDNQQQTTNNDKDNNYNDCFKKQTKQAQQHRDLELEVAHDPGPAALLAQQRHTCCFVALHV